MAGKGDAGRGSDNSMLLQIAGYLSHGENIV